LGRLEQAVKEIQVEVGLMGLHILEVVVVALEQMVKVPRLLTVEMEVLELLLQ
jgi:hypothetical protein